MSDSTKQVECRGHGLTPATFTCRHLASGVGCGFNHGTPFENDPWPDAWCDLCEEVLAQEGGWTDAAEQVAGVTLQCTHCYERARAQNERLPMPLQPGAGRLTVDQQLELQRYASRRVEAMQETAMSRFDLASFARWDVDESARRIIFSSPGRPNLVGDMRVIGSFSRNTNSWLWGWANAAYAEALTEEIEPLRVFGEVRGIERLTTRKWEGTEADAWAVASLAAHVLSADAIYRAPSDHLLVFLLLRNFSTIQ